MSLISYNAFLLGALVFVCIILTNTIFFVLCKTSKIKILEFAIFFDPWFSLYKTKIGYTTYSLGWIPLGSSVKPLGMTKDVEERNKIAEEELPFVFFTRPRYVQLLFKLASPFTYVLIFILVLKLYPNQGNSENVINDIIEVISKSINAMFGSQSSKEEISSIFLKNKFDSNIVLFIFMIFLSVITIILPITTLMNWFSNDEIKKSKIEKAIGFFITLVFFYIFLWKVPKLLFQYYTAIEFCRYLFSFLLGIFCVGSISFFILINVIKFSRKFFNTSK